MHLLKIKNFKPQQKWLFFKIKQNKKLFLKQIESLFVVVIDGNSLSEIIKSKKIMNFLERHINEYNISNSQLAILVYNRCEIREAIVIFYFFL